jgi:hypothetical protein
MALLMLLVVSTSTLSLLFSESICVSTALTTLTASLGSLPFIAADLAAVRLSTYTNKVCISNNCSTNDQPNILA